MAPAESTSEPMLARFRELEQEAANPRSELEAVRDGARIVFRRGQGMIRFTGCVLLVFYLIAGTWLCSWLFHFGSTPGLIATASFTGLMIWTLAKPSRTFQPWTHFALNPARGCIEVYDRRKSAREIPLSEVRCFVAWRVKVRRYSMAGIWVATGERTLRRITGDLGTFGDEKRNVGILGRLCGLPAYYVEDTDRPNEEGGTAQLDLRPVLTPETLIFDPEADGAETQRPTANQK